MGRPRKYSPEVRERAVRLVFDHERAGTLKFKVAHRWHQLRMSLTAVSLARQPPKR